jgi:replicative DNA helicase
MTSDADLEKALIAEALRRYDRFVARGLSLEDFTVGQHIAVLEACQSLWERGEPVSLGSVALELQRGGKPFPGGERGLADLVLHGDKIPDHVRLRELTRLRAVETAACQAALLAKAGDLSGALTALAEVDRMGMVTRQTRTGTVLVSQLMTAVRNPPEVSESRRVYLGLRELDHAVGKLPLGALMVIAADSNVGKSGFSLAMQIAIAKANIGCGLISMEDPEDITGSRLLCAFTDGVSSRELMNDRFEDRDKALRDLERASVQVSRVGEKLLFDDCIGETELEVCAAMSRMAAQGAKLVIVDYVQEIEASKKQQDRRNEVRWVTKRLKTHAKRVGVALVLVSQIARPKDGDEFKAPSKHALKESGDLVNSAEVILVLWRDRVADDADVHVRVAKSKNGGLGLTWSMQRKPSNGTLVER